MRRSGDRPCSGGGRRMLFAAGMLVFPLSSCGDAADWSAMDEPALILPDRGIVLAGDADTPLHLVAGGAFLTDSLVVFGERSTGTLRYYHVDGGLIRQVGGSGDGPEEFSRLEWVRAHEGEVYAYDPGRSRLTRWSAAGELAWSATLRPPDGVARLVPVGVFADGTILAQALAAPGGGAPTEGSYRPRVSLWTVGPRGEALEDVGSFDGAEMYSGPGPGGQGYVSGALPLGRRIGVAVSDDSFYIVDGNAPEVMVHRRGVADAELIELRTGLVNAPVSADDREAMRDRWARDSPPGVDFTEVFDRMPLPSNLPLFGWEGTQGLGLLRVDRDRRVWILEYGGVHEHDTPVWIVVDRSGRMTRVAGDGVLDVLDSSGNLALVREWTDLGEERVALRPIDW